MYISYYIIMLNLAECQPGSDAPYVMVIENLKIQTVYSYALTIQ